MKRSATLTIILAAAMFMFIAELNVGAYHSGSGGAWHYPGGSSQYDYYGSQSSGFYSYGAIDFRAALSPYGMWQFLPELGGHVWIPYVPSGWRPYSFGAWTFTVHGWTWVSYEPWGWIPHHYGNWVFHPMYRWVWVPGYTWAPARVIWGYFNGYYGWAPLPPRHTAFFSYHRSYSRNRSYHWYSRSHSSHSRYSGRHSSGHPSGRSGSQYSGNEHYEWIPNDAWVIVSSNQFMSDNIAEVAVQPGRNMQIIDNRSFSYRVDAPAKSSIERDVRRSIPQTPVDEVRKTVNGNEIQVVRPRQIEPARSRKMNSVQQQFRPADIQNYQRSQSLSRQQRESQLEPSRQPQQTAPSTRPQQQQPAPQQYRPAPQQYQPSSRQQQRAPGVQPRQPSSPQQQSAPPARVQPPSAQPQQATPPAQQQQPSATQRRTRPSGRNVQPSESADEDKDSSSGAPALNRN